MVGYVGIIIFEAAYKITTTYELEINEKSTYNNFTFLIMASCVGPSNRYTVKINRTITPVNGRRIYITTLLGMLLIVLRLIKGKIYFEGEIEEPTAVCLYSNTGTMPILLPFILEQGNITIDYDENQIKELS